MDSDKQPQVMDKDDLLPDYAGPLKNGVRGKYAGRLGRRANLALLAPDVAAAFPTDDSVNEALRSLMVSREATKSAA